MARRFPQPYFLGTATTVNGFEAHGANTNLPLASHGELLPVTRTFPAVELVTTKDARHKMKIDSKIATVKSRRMKSRIGVGDY